MLFFYIVIDLSFLEEEISPIGPPPVPMNDSSVAGPSGLCQFNKRNSFTPTSTSTGGERPHVKLEDKLVAATQRSGTVSEKLNGKHLLNFFMIQE